LQEYSEVDMFEQLTTVFLRPVHPRTRPHRTTVCGV